MHRNQVLRRNRDQRQDRNQRILETEDLFLRDLPPDAGEQLLRDQLGDAGTGDRDRKSAEHRVVHRDTRAAAEAAVKRLDRSPRPQPGDHAAEHRRQDQRKHHIQPQRG